MGCFMEAHGPDLLGASSYKDPITSFPLFHNFSVQHPEASASASASLVSFYIWVTITKNV